MRRVSNNRLDQWVTARADAAAAVFAALVGVRLDVAGLDRHQLEDLVAHLAWRLARSAADAHGPAVAVRRASEELAGARVDQRALHTPAPDYVPPAWAGNLGAHMDLLVSLAARPPATRCTGCAAALPAFPWLTDRLWRAVFCDGCAIAAGHGELVALVGAARAALATANPEQAEAIARELLDRCYR